MTAPEYVTEVSSPAPARVAVLQALRSRMIEPEPLPDLEPELEAGR